ncbi:hypothetical protein [Fodinicola acaciae]|nr:hypothetical protein [Fodinicola acaciae]
MTADEFDLDIRVDDHRTIIADYPEPTQQGTCHSRDVSCYPACQTTAKCP